MEEEKPITEVSDDNIEDAEPLASSTMIEDPNEKKVTVSDNPEVFDMVPDSTEVKLVEPPPSTKGPDPDSSAPVGPTLNLDMIITETIDIIEQHKLHTAEQKLTMSKMAFMLNRIQESVNTYLEHAHKMNNFLIANDLLQAEWYYTICRHLPTYGDYVLALKDSPEKIKVDEVPYPVSEAELLKLTSDVVQNYYAGGAHVKTQRIMCKDIYAKMDERKAFIRSHLASFDSWFKLFNIEIGNEDKIIDKLFEVSAYIDFLKIGDSSVPLKLTIKQD